jgi:DeoR/GlpR family transcriptional regulator of sugar metabolism
MSVYNPNERQKKILNVLEQRENARVSELSDLLGVSVATIRRDLNKLREMGEIERFHGGAVLSLPSAPEPPVIQRSNENITEKERIGKTAAALIQDGDVIFIGSGTTALEVARNLLGYKNLTVITNSLTVINKLGNDGNITLVSTGGIFRRSELSFIGHLTENALSELRPQKVIMGIRAISLQDGLTNEYLPEVNTDRAIIRAASEVIIVADHSKFGKVSTAFVAPINAIHKLVTDDRTSKEIIASIQAQGVEVIVC